METRKKQISKAGRVTVPFYNPPTRQYGQTPSEIIREARASVMNMSATGIKPVSTSRPYTPKEKERILFGNVKRRLSRPPSAFSLSYLQRPEALPRVKLPAIQSPTQKKTGHNNGVRSVLSLDNLPEAYESEVLQDSEFDFKVVPVFQKSDARSSDKKMTRAFTLASKVSLKIPARSEINFSQPYVDFLSCSNDDIYLNYSEEAGKQPEFPSKSSQQNKASLSNILSDSESEEKNLELSPSNENLTTSIEKATSLVKTKLPGHSYEITDEKEEMCKLKASDSNTEETQPVESTQIQKFTEILPQCNHTGSSVDNRQFCPVNGKSSDSVSCNSNVNTDTKSVSLKEKCVATEIIPKYFSLVNNGPRHKTAESCSISKEIHELYETASYYGVFSNQKSEISEEQPPIKSGIIETNCGKDPFPEGERLLKDSDYLHVVKESIKNFDLKMKNLSANIESFEEKLNGGKKIYSQAKSEVDTSDIPTFKMNNNVKHRKPQTQENKIKTYRKYFDNVENFANPKKESETVGWDGFWKNSYYKQKTEMDNSDLDQQHAVLEDHLARLTEIKNETLTDAESKEIVRITSGMYKLLKKGDLVRNYTDQNEMKITVLKSVYKFAENEYPEILLNLARIIFALKLENSLSAACKMVFKVARSDANDHLFLELDDILDLFLDGIGLASPLDEGECCIYGYGALKFLTMNHRILSKLMTLGALDLMILHLKIISSAKLEGITLKEQTQYALFQLTGALRNIAAGDGALPLFITTNSIPVLCKILHHFRQCEDIVTNISRILSQLSSDEDVTQILMSVDNILGTMIELLEQFKSNYKILVRLSYCLGNIMAYSDKARVQLSRSETYVTTLIRILQFYVDKDLDFFLKKKTGPKTESQHKEEGELDNDIIDDIIVKILALGDAAHLFGPENPRLCEMGLVSAAADPCSEQWKVIRIIANMCMNPLVGSNLSPNEDNEENSLKLSHLLATLLQRKDPGITLLACLGCLNNISYYCNNHSSLIDITEGTIRVLGLHDEECNAEAARVLGNLTRHKNIRDLICSTGGIHRLTKLLDSNDKDVYRSACGALVNLMLDYDTRKIFVESHGIDKLTEGLEKFSGDWVFAGLICRAIWNSCADDMAAVMSHNDFEKLVNILASSLDEENWNDGDPVWEEFALLATDLLEKINAYMEVT